MGALQSAPQLRERLLRRAGTIETPEHCPLAASTSPCSPATRRARSRNSSSSEKECNTGDLPHRQIAPKLEGETCYGGRAWRPWGGVTASCAAPTVGQSQIGDILLVTVRDNNIDQALKFLKKKMQREGIFREMKLRSAYEKPSERKVREKADAIRRARKLARKTAIRDGLIAAPKPKTPAPGQRKPAFAQR